MNINGKILFFSAADGKGTIITSNKEKLSFSVQDWDDFEIMPSLGLEVSFKCNNNIPTSIVCLSNAPIQDEESESEDVEEECEEEYYEEDEEEYYEEDDSEEETSTEHFETDEDITTIEDELEEREESVTVTLNLSKAVENYFDIIDDNIERRSLYKKVDGRLDYLLVRRFLWTTFNNLSEIDLHIINPKIKSLSDDLKAMSKVYDDFVIKTKHPPLAYEEVFLSCQSEYLKIRDGAEKTIEKLNLLKGNEKHVGGILKIKKEELDQDIDTDEFDVLKDELKSLNGTYVDIVHMMAELDERYKHDMELLKEFEAEYRSDFYKLFDTAAQRYKKSLVDVLSAQAYLLDEKLWIQAKTSKAVIAYFRKASIEGEFNTKTYLKYYLDSFDSSRMTGDTKKLFDLYQYLCSLHKDYVLVVAGSAQDAMEYETGIKAIDKSIDIKSFIDEKAALKWAMKNSVKILVIEDELAKIRVDTFLKYYKKYILASPKIILLGNKPKSDEFTITKLLSKSVSSRVIAKSVKELLCEMQK